MVAGTTLLLYRNEEGNADSIALEAWDKPSGDIAWQAPDASKADFEWLANSVATFHNIPLRIIS
jgi:hypothetical protein